jgi:hypothetical protein
VRVEANGLVEKVLHGFEVRGQLEGWGNLNSNDTEGLRANRLDRIVVYSTAQADEFTFADIQRLGLRVPRGPRQSTRSNHAGLTGRQLAELTGFHFTKISRVEHGAQGLSDADIDTWCLACGASDEIPALIAQARAADSLYREWKRQARSGLTVPEFCGVPVPRR